MSLAECNQNYGNDTANFVQDTSYLRVTEAIKAFTSKNAVVKKNNYKKHSPRQGGVNFAGGQKRNE